MKSKQMTGRENKPHIGLYGRCNAGKSTLLNFITCAPAALVSATRGTTTDPVRKSFEIAGFAPVILIDTAGIDDASPLGGARVKATLGTLAQIDLALLVWREWGEPERELVLRFREAAIPFIPVYNMYGSADPCPEVARVAAETGCEVVPVCAVGDDAAQRDRLLDGIKARLPEKSYRTPSLFGDRVGAGEFVLLVCPIDAGAPAGRLILPQVQTVRELLDRHAVTAVVQPEQLDAFFALGVRPKLVVSDSQVLAEVSRAVPDGIEITSFSILLAAAKGDPAAYGAGLDRIESLKGDDRVLIVEHCFHQASCDDIGRVKIPRWLEAYTGQKLRFGFIAGLAPLPDDLADYALMVQCGGCMATRSQLQNRIRAAVAAGVPVTNYGMLIRKIRTGR